MDNEFLPDLYELEDENGNKQEYGTSSNSLIRSIMLSLLIMRTVMKPLKIQATL